MEVIVEDVYYGGYGYGGYGYGVDYGYYEGFGGYPYGVDYGYVW